MRTWLDALAAVLVGNLVYFAVLIGVLPPWLRHVPFRFDAGLLLDFALCVAVYLLLGVFLRRASPPGRRDVR